MTVKKIKRDLRDKILDAMDNGESMTKAEMLSYVKRRANRLSFEDLRAYATKRMVSECIGQIKQSHRKDWLVNGRQVTDMPHNVDGQVTPERLVGNDEAIAIVTRNDANIAGRISEHAAMVKRFERRLPLTADAKRRRRQLDSFIRSWGL